MHYTKDIFRGLIPYAPVETADMVPKYTKTVVATNSTNTCFKSFFLLETSSGDGVLMRLIIVSTIPIEESGS